MVRDELTQSELDLLAGIPGPPLNGSFSTNCLCIVEWLDPSDEKTGYKLFEWAKFARPGWVLYYPCRSTLDVREALKDILKRSNDGVRPILHFETHGCEQGIAPDNQCRGGFIAWEDLNGILQEINRETGCNLLVVASMCVGLWSMKIFSKGPFAPAACFVGPDSVAYPLELLRGAIEFYQKYIECEHDLGEFVASASREAGGLYYDYEPAAVFAFETLCEELISKSREVDVLLIAGEIQALWDEMFGIDIRPENEERFGVNWYKACEIIADFREQTLPC